MLKYSNGWGHLLMSIFLTLVGLALIVVPGIPSSAQGVGIGLILAVQAAWFVPGAAKQVAHEVADQLQNMPAGSVASVPAESDPNKVPTVPRMPAVTINNTNGGQGHD